MGQPGWATRDATKAPGTWCHQDAVSSLLVHSVSHRLRPPPGTCELSESRFLGFCFPEAPDTWLCPLRAVRHAAFPHIAAALTVLAS